MTKVTTSKDCGNSPKNKFAEELALAIEKNDTNTISAALTEDVVWDIGLKTINGINGKESYLAKLVARKKIPTKIVVDHVVTHGKAGAVNGTSSCGKNDEVRFCHVLEFSNAKCTKLSRICSYEARS